MKRRFFVSLAICIITFPLFFQAYANQKLIYSPYKDATLNAHWDNDTGTMVPEDINSISQDSGIKHFTLAFITSDPTNVCTPSWGGAYPMVVKPEGKPEYVWGLNDINRLKKSGGDVTIAFGGASGTYLASSCATYTDLQNAYQKVITTYNVKNLDFDVEGAALATPALVNKMIAAIVNLQQVNPDLNISFTLPVLPEGLTSDGIKLVQTAQAAGVKISHVNIMAMDYGPSYPADQMAKNAIAAAHAVHDQVGGAWSAIAITPMVGINDVQPERFTLDDVKTVVDFAKATGIEQMGSWSVNRDHPCDQQWASPLCSGAHDGKRLQNNDYDFARAFSQ